MLGDLLWQAEHLRVVLLVDLGLHVHDQLALQGSILLLGQVVQFLDLLLEVGVLQSELCDCVQQNLVHRELSLVFEREVGAEVQSFLLIL